MQKIAICFKNKKISSLFSSLLTNLNLEIKEVNSVKNLPNHYKIITEPVFIDSKNLNNTSLIVSNTKTNLGNFNLTRPLTENKINTKLNEFINY